MYDVRSEAKEFIADTRAEAVSKATSFFDCDESALRIKEYDPITVSGLSNRILVVAQPTASVGQLPRSGDRDRGDRDRGDRGDRGGRERGGRDRGRSDRGDRDRGRGRERGDRDRGRGRDRDARPAEPAAVMEPSEPSRGTAQGEIGEVGQFLLGLMERMDLGPFTLAKSEEDKFVVYQVEGEAAHGLTGGDGRTADAIQLIGNQVALLADEDAKRIVVDVEGNQDKRDDFLGRMADRAAKRARETGRSVGLDPMNPRDRRGIHVALRDADGVATMSIGEGRYRQVVVVPEGAPEYDEAVAASSSSEG